MVGARRTKSCWGTRNIFFSLSPKHTQNVIKKKKKNRHQKSIHRVTDRKMLRNGEQHTTYRLFNTSHFRLKIMSFALLFRCTILNKKLFLLRPDKNLKPIEQTNYCINDMIELGGTVSVKKTCRRETQATSLGTPTFRLIFRIFF